MDSSWWKPTARHIWRTYFAIKRNNPASISPATQRSINACSTILATTPPEDIPLLEAYFSSRWGEDIPTVRTYAVQHNTPEYLLWTTIHRAERALLVQLGILDGKDDNS